MENQNNKQQTIEVAINDIVIKQQDASKPINFEFMKNQGNQILKNNGDALIVTKSNGKDKTTTMSKQQVLAIQNNDIKVYANFDTFSKAIKEKNISQTFALTETTSLEETISGTSTQETSPELSLLSLLTTSENRTLTTENTQEISENISSVMTDGKQVLNPEQNEKIR